MKTNYTGIDYGRGMTNIDHETGIRFGVINQSEVLQAWCDEAEGEYGKPVCPNCFNEVEETSDYQVNGESVYDIDGNEIEDEYYCSVCDQGIDENDPDIYPDEPLAHIYINDGYNCFQSGGDTDVFVLKSPYYTWCQFCSPCAPGAGYLTNWTDKDIGVKAYCFGHDWYEAGKAPYPVYRVSDNSLVD